MDIRGFQQKMPRLVYLPCGVVPVSFVPGTPSTNPAAVKVSSVVIATTYWSYVPVHADATYCHGNWLPSRVGIRGRTGRGGVSTESGWSESLGCLHEHLHRGEGILV